MISFIANELQEKLDERIHVALVDHLNFEVKRLSNSEEMNVKLANNDFTQIASIILKGVGGKENIVSINKLNQ